MDNDTKWKWMLRGVSFAVWVAIAVMALIIMGVIVFIVAGIYWLIKWIMGG